MACVLCTRGGSLNRITQLKLPCLRRSLRCLQVLLADLRPRAHDAAAQLALRRAAAARHAAAARLAGPAFARRPDLCEAACRLLAAAARGGGALSVGAARALMAEPLAAAAEALNGGGRRGCTPFQVSWLRAKARGCGPQGTSVAGQKALRQGRSCNGCERAFAPIKCNPPRVAAALFARPSLRLRSTACLWTASLPPATGAPPSRTRIACAARRPASWPGGRWLAGSRRAWGAAAARVRRQRWLACKETSCCRRSRWDRG
jgi:hypothetical protein